MPRRQTGQKDGFLILLYARGQLKVYSRCILGAAMKLAFKLFTLPGNLVADLLGAAQSDDRTMIRTLIDMLFWNVVVVVGALVIFL